jgi:hypothetical protein
MGIGTIILNILFSKMYGGFMENIKELAMESILGTGECQGRFTFPHFSRITFPHLLI